MEPKQLNLFVTTTSNLFNNPVKGQESYSTCIGRYVQEVYPNETQSKVHEKTNPAWSVKLS